MTKYLSTVCLRTVVIFCCWMSLAAADTLTSQTLSTTQLIKSLQQGGHVLYMRHGTTNHSQKDTNRRSFEDCSTQRNLSDEGRAEAKQIGAVIAKLNIPIADVVSSPYCRCRDTANLAFEKYRVDLDLRFSISHDKSEAEMLGKGLKALILQSDTEEGNVVFVGHSSNLRDGLGVWPKPEGVIVVFKVVDKKAVLKGMIYPDEWSSRDLTIK